MAKRRGFGATGPVHAGEARHAIQRAITIARHVVSHVRKGAPHTVCSGGLNSLANAYESLGIAGQEARHGGNSQIAPALRKAKRWVAVAHRTVATRCLVR